MAPTTLPLCQICAAGSNRQQGAGFSPLTAGLQSQHSRASLSSPRSSRDSLLDAEQQPSLLLQLPQPQLQQQQQLLQQWQQQEQQQQLQPQQTHAVAYVSVNGSKAGNDSPRSPSRLRYVRKDSAAATAPQLPDFLQVQELPPGVLHQVRMCPKPMHS